MDNYDNSSDQLIQQQFDQQIHDQVMRDMIFDDWKKNTRKTRRDSRQSIIVLLIAILLFIGAYCAFLWAAPPNGSDINSSEIYKKEMLKVLSEKHSLNDGSSEQYESLLNDESRELYDEMNQKMEEIKKQEEEQKAARTRMMLICAIPPLLFLGYVIYSYAKLDGIKATPMEVFIAIVVSIAIAAVLYIIHLLFYYMRFYAESSLRALFLGVVMLVAAIVLWRKHIREKQKKE